MDDLAGLDEYVNIVHHCFDVYLSIGIMRLPGGCDYSKVIGQEEQVSDTQVHLPNKGAFLFLGEPLD